MKTSKIYLLAILLLSTVFRVNGQIYKKPNYSPTYEEIISFYKNLDKKYPQASLVENGETDIGKPLHVFIIDKDPKKSSASMVKIMINNGIHPGEPDGINASMQLADEILLNWKKYQSLFDTVELYIIPVYNVDGCLRRGNSSRANQDGPSEYGFRGNYQNLDLNRDFIKADSKNALTFIKNFRVIDPHIMVDTHVSNGADYQYTFTYFFSNWCQQYHYQGSLSRKLEEFFKSDMLKKNIETVPYVNHHAETPLEGIHAFYDSPRYCTGYTSLFGCISITTETHMLKPFDERVRTTYESLQSLLKMASKHRSELLALKTSGSKEKEWKEIGLNYKMDTSSYEIINFKGYEPYYKKSEVTGLDQLYYDRSKPIEKTINYYNIYKPSLLIRMPDFYLVPQSWSEVNERLTINLKGIGYERLSRDTVLKTEVYFVVKTGVGKNPYEGHYYHHDLVVEKKIVSRKFYKGDYLYRVNHSNAKFLANVLEPEAEDSYFRWNFFDACLQQKEWFSDYVFDEKAKEILEKDPELRNKFDIKKASDPQFAKSSWDQLYYIYKNSPFYEQTAYEIPVYKIFR